MMDDSRSHSNEQLEGNLLSYNFEFYVHSTEENREFIPKLVFVGKFKPRRVQTTKAKHGDSSMMAAARWSESLYLLRDSSLELDQWHVFGPFRPGFL